jgi:hypothetical protein
VVQAVESKDAPVLRAQPVAKFAVTLPRAALNPALDIAPVAVAPAPEYGNPAYLDAGAGTQPDWTARSAYADAGPSGERDRMEILMESAEMGGLALSVGVVWWASRVGGLVGSLLASMPAWRHLDPLPILGRDKDEDGEDERDQADAVEADADEVSVSMVLDRET